MAGKLLLHSNKGIFNRVQKLVAPCGRQPRHVLSHVRARPNRGHLTARLLCNVAYATPTDTTDETSASTGDVADQSILQEAPSFEDLGVDEMFMVSFSRFHRQQLRHLASL